VTSPPPRLRTERLVLRRWRPEDAALLHPVLDASAEHLRPWVPARVVAPEPLPALQARLGRWAADFEAGREWLYGVFPPGEREVLGGVGLYPRGPAGRVPYADADHVEIGYWLRADATGSGRATEAVRAALAVARALPRLRRVEIRCDARNVRSAALPARLGFRHVRDAAAPAVDGGAPVTLMVWALDAADAGAGDGAGEPPAGPA
jgi:RimJ/RimL family protein N-acetyltransferase